MDGTIVAKIGPTSRKTFQQLSRVREREAKALLASREFAGAYYLLGYAVECALKACITKQFDKQMLYDWSYLRSIHTHQLDQLLSFSGLGDDLKRDKVLDLQWTVVKDWTEQARYDPTISESTARALFRACATPKAGVLPWLRKHW